MAVPARGESAPGHRRTQDIPLAKGWNAVFLEVDPDDDAPASVFAGLPVDKVATLFGNPSTNQFVTDPGADLFRSTGWGVWYAPGLPEAFLKSLDAIEGNRAYLIHAKAGCQWRPTGAVNANPVAWRPDAYNLVGFPVRPTGGPTFAQFFAGSKAHQGQTIYRLANGRWKKVLQPGGEAMKAGEAFWIYCKGRSDYQGPLRVQPPLRRGVLLGRLPARLVLRNEGSYPVGATIEQVPGAGPGVPLSIVVQALGDPAAPVQPVGVPKPSGSWQQALPTLEVGAAIAVPLECRPGEMLQPRQTSLLRITSDLGTVHWVPVECYRDDLGE